ncbi:MAG: DUF2480 family protein [Bacteroidetes bacterium]|nr:DUF2480 family protein [Bacteroidota bacterium]
METIINKVANSGIITINLEDYYDKNERVVFDIKDCLYMGLILKEKDFREFVKNNDWTVYKNKNVAIVCTADAIVPTWAFMLVGSKLSGIANYFVFGNTEQLENSLFQMALSNIDVEQYRNHKIVVKGCGNLPVPVFAYVEILKILQPVASSVMYGEPCSTVPVFKKLNVEKNKP